jgi:hypothetical protein
MYIGMPDSEMHVIFVRNLKAVDWSASVEWRPRTVIVLTGMGKFGNCSPE